MRPRAFKALRPVRERKPCEAAGLVSCLELDCHYWDALRGSCRWKPAAERQAPLAAGQVAAGSKYCGGALPRLDTGSVWATTGGTEEKRRET